MSLEQRLRMPAGKHKGERLSELPSDYLYWVAENWSEDRIASAADSLYRERSDKSEHWYEDTVNG